MTGLLNHAPAEVIQQLLVDLELATLPGDDVGAWPVFFKNRPDAPDDLISTHTTEARSFGRSMPDGEQQMLHGVIVTIRANDDAAGYQKAMAIADAFDRLVLNESVTIASSSYMLDSISRSSDVLSIGFERGSRRYLYTVNCLVAMSAS